MSSKIKSGLVREPSYISKDLDKAAEIALFYGFQPIKTPRIEKSDISNAASFLSDREETGKSTFPRLEEKISLLRTMLELELGGGTQPSMFQYKRPISQLSIKRLADEQHYTLDIVGSRESMAEAIAIRTAVAILADHGYGKIIVDINSLGDKDSIAHFEKELTNFTRKHSAHIPVESKQQFKKDPFEVWRCNHEKWLEVRERAPQSLSYLSENSIEHFRQVLEYLETLDIPYRINHSLIGNRHFCSHTVFEIKGTQTIGADLQIKTDPKNTEIVEETFAVGTRHNYIAKKIGFKRETPMVSANIRFKRPSAAPKLFFKGKPQPKFFFIQFGTIAKLKSLSVIESLRQARIPVHHMLTDDKFIGQLSAAESTKSPFVIIMGQKEALENTVVVRHMGSRSQEIIQLPDLPRYLTKLG